jgi:hypothetical protein
MQRLASVISALAVASLLCGAHAAGAQSPAPAQAQAQSVAEIVSQVAQAGRSAASDVYVVHQYGPNLGLSTDDVAKFDAQYSKLSADANGLLDTIAAAVASDRLDPKKLAAATKVVADEGHALDDTIAGLKARSRSSSPSQFGLSPADLFKPIASVLDFGGGTVSLTIVTRSTAGGETSEQRAAFAAEIRRQFWPDVRNAGQGVVPSPSPAPK